jgi:citrate lyase synthetase
MFDYAHPNKTGALVVAKQLLEKVSNNKFLKIQENNELAPNRTELMLGLYSNVANDIEAHENEISEITTYLKYLQAHSLAQQRSSDQIFGSVAVNCNPITKGHEHLINYARSKVAHLYVLVIEEDKSEVSFRDRLAMVAAVCSSMQNVTVLKGGKYVCTEYIAPEYFSKQGNELQNVDFSLESYYFGSFIAPTLGITKIFLGEEPFCNITQQYNKHMLSTMHEYGVELTIIPRIADGAGAHISASQVRSLIKSKKWEQVMELVPRGAFEYILRNNLNL